MLQTTTQDRLKDLFAENGEVTHCHMPRSAANPALGKGFAFVHFKHSFAADR